MLPQMGAPDVLPDDFLSVAPLPGKELDCPLDVLLGFEADSGCREKFLFLSLICLGGPHCWFSASISLTSWDQLPRDFHTGFEEQCLFWSNQTLDKLDRIPRVHMGISKLSPTWEP